MDYADFCKVAELMKPKAHLTASGLEQIRKLKAGMNTGRKMSTGARPQLNQIKKIKTLYPSRGETAKALGISPRSVGRYISGKISQPCKVYPKECGP